MKIMLSALSVLLFTMNVHAVPAVGDSATFQGTWGPDNISQTLTYTAFNSVTRQFTKVTTTTIGTNAPATATDLVNFNDTASDAALKDLVENCTARGGVPESILVPAGTFNSCKMSDNNGGTVWFGQVPFAVLWWHTTTGGKELILRLVTFTRGTVTP